MRNLRVILPSLALAALTATGCFIVSGQIFVHFELPNPVNIDGADGWELVPVDLADVGKDYSDNKDKLKDITDLAIVGTFKNTAGPGGTVEVWITPGTTSLAGIAAIKAGATRLWGPASIGAAPSSVTIGWDESAKLFNPAGKAILLSEAKGDGQFTLYTIGTAGVTNSIEIDNGALILTLAAGF
jgi:hypothetical protein